MTTQLLKLNDFDLIRITGEDSARFLQGQLTCDVDKVSSGQSMPGACCNLKGRVIGDFRLFLTGDDYLLLTEAGMGQILRKQLDKYIVFSKATTALVENYERYGLIGEDSPTIMASLFSSSPQSDGAVVQSGDALGVRLPTEEPQLPGEPQLTEEQPRFELLVPSEQSELQEALLSTPLLSTPLESQDRWTAADIGAGIVHVSPAMQEVYTPQLLNYDIGGVVDFKKGCYTGQEVVARMYYRSTAKKRLFRAEAAVPSVARGPEGQGRSAGLAIRTETGENPVGEVLSSARDGGRIVLLAILPVNLIDNKESLYLDSDGEPVRLENISVAREGFDNDQ